MGNGWTNGHGVFTPDDSGFDPAQHARERLAEIELMLAKRRAERGHNVIDFKPRGKR